MTEREEAVKPIEDRLLMAYTRIRGNVRNGLAVVTGEARRLRWLLQHRAPSAPGRHHFAQENHRVRALRPDSGRRRA